jgi:hypothetical protein
MTLCADLVYYVGLKCADLYSMTKSKITALMVIFFFILTYQNKCNE